MAENLEPGRVHMGDLGDSVLRDSKERQEGGIGVTQSELKTSRRTQTYMFVTAAAT